MGLSGSGKMIQSVSSLENPGAYGHPLGFPLLVLLERRKGKQKKKKRKKKRKKETPKEI